MNPALPDEAIEFGAAAARAIADLGGVDAARQAEASPAFRADSVAPVLQSLGVDDLDPLADGDSLAAGAALCEAAGRAALPYPVASVLLRDTTGAPFAVVGSSDRVRVDHGDLFGTWRVATLDGLAGTATPHAPGGTRLGSRLGPFVTDLHAPSPFSAQFSSNDEPKCAENGIWLALTAMQILGTVDRAVELAVDHVTGRVQFGKPLSAFQAVQFQLADAAVAVAGLRELAHFTLWRVSAAPDQAFTDVLALRVHAIDVARMVLRTTQQLHGAAGVCDEYDISVLARHIQPALRLPCSAERTTEALVGSIEQTGFDGPFSHGGAA